MLLNELELLNCPEFCYFLGYLYADGSIYRNKDMTYEISIVTTEHDLEYFRNIFKIFYDFKEYSQKTSNPKWKTLHKFTFNNKKLSSFLLKIGFDNKSENAKKILSYITSENLKQLFFTGYFDGDGCVYYNEKYCLRHVTITSCFTQNWDFINELCETLGIKNSSIVYKKSDKRQSSVFRICNKKEFNIFLSYIYNNDNYGFNRKKEKHKLAMSTVKYGPTFETSLRKIKKIKYLKCYS